MSRVLGPGRKFLPQEWRLATQMHVINSMAETTRSERLGAESRRLIEEGEKVSKRLQQDAEKKLELRIQDLQFWRKELEKKLEEITEEIELLIPLKARVEKAVESCIKPLHVTLQCLEERQKRVSIDLVHDEVEQELMKEKEVLEGVASLLKHTVEQIVEQIRLNRSAKYHLEKALRDKFQAERIDDSCAVLTSSTLQSGAPPTDTQPPPADGSQVSPAEWEGFCDLLLCRVEQARGPSLLLRSLTSGLLEQTAGDAQRQHHATATALRMHVQETRAAKEQLEEQLATVLYEVSSQEKNMAAVEVALQETQVPLQLAQARLKLRVQRSNVEQCKDQAQAQLTAEVRELTAQIHRLQALHADLVMQLKALTRSQQSLEEAVQMKAASLYIDQVICSQLHLPAIILSF